MFYNRSACVHRLRVFRVTRVRNALCIFHALFIINTRCGTGGAAPNDKYVMGEKRIRARPQRICFSHSGPTENKTLVCILSLIYSMREAYARSHRIHHSIAFMGCTCDECVRLCLHENVPCFSITVANIIYNIHVWSRHALAFHAWRMFPFSLTPSLTPSRFPFRLSISFHPQRCRQRCTCNVAKHIRILPVCCIIYVHKHKDVTRVFCHVAST